jgi:anti-sigma factor RsiW
MNCQAFEPWIALYVEGDLPVADTPLVEEHIAVCADCRELLRDLRESQAVVKELAAEAVDGALLTAVRAGVMEGTGNRRRLVWPWVATATAALALLALFLTPSRRPAPEPRPVAVAHTPPKVEAAVSRADPPARRRRPRRRAVSVGPPAPQPQLVVKMLTDDPDIVIIWLVDQTGD